METKGFKTSILLNHTPSLVFKAIQNVPGWWNPDMKGASKEKGDKFEVQFGPTQKSISRSVKKKIKHY